MKRDRREWMRRTHTCMLVPVEVVEEARRTGRSTSRLIRYAWFLARAEIRRLPGAPR